MNNIAIEKIDDLDQLLNFDIYLTGKYKDQMTELAYNTWQISFDNMLIQQLKLADLKYFIAKLIKERSLQVERLGTTKHATFYMWVDQMSLQLCFDILSGKNIKLPFNCTVHVIKDYDIILKNFLKKAKKAAQRGCHIPLEDITFLEPGDPGFGQEITSEPKDWIQDVYVTTITWKSLLKE